MTTPTADKLRIYYPSKYLTADNQAITQQTADAGGSVTTIVDAALTQANDYWNGAVGWFDGATTTVALQGIFFHVTDFIAASDTLVLSKELPAAPAAGDTYRLVLGGNWRSTQECMGMLAGGVQPELISVTGTNITGLVITKISPMLGAGTLSVSYDDTLELLYIKMGSGNYGVGLDVSGDVTAGIVMDENDTGWIQVNVTSGSLPGSDQVDTFTLTIPEATLTPDYEGAETTAGKTRYRLEVIKNTDATETMVGVEVWDEKPSGTDTTIASGTLTTAAGSFVATDASDWPVRSFWVKNTTKTDCRYVKYRSGNTIYCSASGVTLRDYTCTTWVATDAIEIMSDLDLALDAPSTLQFENPATEETAPSATFYDVGEEGNALAIGDMTAGEIYGVWRRETIVAGARARNDIPLHTQYSWS
jgi:hypothetical protein